jgi:hypothetical protein
LRYPAEVGSAVDLLRSILKWGKKQASEAAQSVVIYKGTKGECESLARILAASGIEAFTQAESKKSQAEKAVSDPTRHG